MVGGVSSRWIPRERVSFPLDLTHELAVPVGPRGGVECRNKARHGEESVAHRARRVIASRY